MADKNAAEFNELYPKTEYQPKADKQKLEDWTKDVYDKINETSKTNTKANAEIPQSSSAEGKGSDIEHKTPQNAAGGTPSSNANVIYWSKDIKKEERENKEKINKLNEFVKNNPTQDEVIDFIIKTYPDLKDREYVVNQLDYLFENGRKKYDIKLDDVRTIPVDKQESQNEQTPQTSATTTTDTTPEAEEKKPTAEPTLSLNDDDFKAIEDFGKKVDKTLQEEYTPAHQFYSRIFSVPEWFPKGLDEFREKKKELTDKPVYDKKSGKYVRNTTGKMATAKAEQEMAEEVIDGLQRDVNRAKLKGFVSDPVLNKRSKEQYEKSVSVLNDIDKQIDDIDKEYNDLSAIEYKGTDFDSIAKEQDRKERLSTLRQQREEAKNKLSEQEDIVNKFKTQYETRGDATSNLIESQQETIDAIKNGDLKDANEAVDNLKKEYSAAKRKLIKENAGNIARNVWFIIDLVTTMNRNAARLMPQGKYSPNLGNFETPALFQDYAAQLQNIRDAYNKVNTQAAEGRVSAEVGKALGATEALNSYMRNESQIPYDKFKAYLDFTLYKQKNWESNEVQKDFAKYLRQLGLDYERHKFNQDLVLAFQTGPKFLSNMNPEELDDWNKFSLAQSKDENDASMAFLKKLALGIDKDGKLSTQEKAEKYADLFMSAIKSKAVRQGSDENTRIYLNQIDKIKETIATGKSAESLVMDLITDIMTGGVSHILKTETDAGGNVVSKTETITRGGR